MTGEEVIVTDLLQDALIVIRRCVEGLPADVQMKVAAGITAGGSMELRVRMANNRVPHISVHMAGDAGSIELAAAGGGLNP